MKTRRSDRLVDMARYMLERPRTLISLSYFAKRYDSAKSSISEMPKEPVLEDDDKVADTTQTRPNMEHSAEVHEHVDNHTEEHHSEGDSI